MSFAFLLKDCKKWHNVMAGFFADYTFVDFSSPANFIADYTFIHFADPPSPHRQLSASWIKRRHALTVDMSYHHMTYHIWHITDHLVSRNSVKEKKHWIHFANPEKITPATDFLVFLVGYRVSRDFWITFLRDLKGQQRHRFVTFCIFSSGEKFMIFWGHIRGN